MPRRVLDLRRSDGKHLETLAAFRVLAVMCHPTDAAARQRMFNRLKAETGAGRVRGARITNAEFLDQVRGCKSRVAGALLLNLLQLNGNGRRPSLNDAIRMLQALFDPWTTPTGSQWREFDWIPHFPRRRSNLLKIFPEYLSASHLWAALLHAEEHQREDIWPGDPATLPRFIAYAEAFAAMASQVPWSGRGRRLLLPPDVPWRFVLPEHLVEHAELQAEPLEPEQTAALNTPTD